MTLLSFDAPGRFASFEGSYVRWSNRYSNETILVNDRHVNHTLTLSAASVVSGATNSNGRRASLSIRLVSRTYARPQRSIRQSLGRAGEPFADAVAPFGPFDLGAAANILWSAASGFHATPSLSTTVYLGKLVRLLASASRIVGLPSFNDLYWQFDGYSEGNPDLATETGWKFKAGAMLLALPFYGTISAAYTRSTTRSCGSHGRHLETRQYRQKRFDDSGRGYPLRDLRERPANPGLGGFRLQPRRERRSGFPLLR